MSNLVLIAKISPVGPFIGCTPARSYATKLGIARRINEIRTGSKPATGPASVEPPLNPGVPADAPPPPNDVVGGASVRNARSSLKNLSWFSRSCAVWLCVFCFS